MEFNPTRWATPSDESNERSAILDSVPTKEILFVSFDIFNITLFQSKVDFEINTKLNAIWNNVTFYSRTIVSY